jgi:hypothetical protein
MAIIRSVEMPIVVGWANSTLTEVTALEVGWLTS